MAAERSSAVPSRTPSVSPPWWGVQRGKTPLGEKEVQEEGPPALPLAQEGTGNLVSCIKVRKPVSGKTKGWEILFQRSCLRQKKEWEILFQKDLPPAVKVLPLAVICLRQKKVAGAIAPEKCPKNYVFCYIYSTFTVSMITCKASSTTFVSGWRTIT